MAATRSIGSVAGESGSVPAFAAPPIETRSTFMSGNPIHCADSRENCP